jgi:hypothetical protein
MPQSNPPSKLDLRKRLKLPPPKLVKEKSLFEEYPYVFFGLAFLLITLLAHGGGMSFRDALILSAWLVSIAFFGWQVAGVRKRRSVPETPKPKRVEAPRKRAPTPAKNVDPVVFTEARIPRWPPPPPRLVAPLSTTMAKKSQDKQKTEAEQNPKPSADQNPKQ